MEWLLEIVLIFLLSATLFHALRLEKALGVLKSDRAALEELVSSFNSSTRLAEQGIERLRNAADGAGRQISRQIDVASSLKEDLVFLSERGEGLADRLEKLVRSGRIPHQDTAPDFREPKPDFLAASREPVRAERATPSSLVQPETEEPGPRLRSQAERDLLKALRMARS